MNIGDVIGGRYTVNMSLAEGGMGRLFVAHDSALGRDVAVKVLPAESVQNPDDVERFQREVHATAALNHPHIVTIHDAGVHEGAPFLVMELLPGPDLGTSLAERGVLAEPDVISIGRQVASALAVAHDAGIVHRDIKPANLVYDAHRLVRVVDFGIARMQQHSAQGLTTAGTVVGSAAFVAPEQVMGQVADARSDLYQLGCVLMVLLTGQPPFQAEHVAAALHAHVHEPAPRVSSRRPDVSPSVDQLVAQLLEKDPSARPASAHQVVAALEACEVGAPLPPLGTPPAGPSESPATPHDVPDATAHMAASTQVMPDAPPAPGPAGVPAPATDLVPATGPSRSQRNARPDAPAPRRRGMTYAFIAMVLLCLGAGGWVYMQVTKQPSASTATSTVDPVPTSTPPTSTTTTTSEEPSPTTTTSYTTSTTTTTTQKPVPSQPAADPDSAGDFVDALVQDDLIAPQRANDVEHRLYWYRKAVEGGDNADIWRRRSDMVRYVDRLLERGEIRDKGANTLLKAVGANRSDLNKQRD